ncbi:MAG TPA: DUF3606 domain-containing protein [Ramlibacter sp.]|uniref:DUF3606 domain-containing protein n=1 Tax=Ramlibacter sp. TaxID=1917967 RepID=UPI002B649014|nr:DUF3606 domain-containing protein [Ramlibacter sp.]HVZ44326.1 DUF3606 domain-containing protein [Ramlibacter sp.]
MDGQSPTPAASPVIDLTKQADVLYWCRIFDLTMEELREAVHHAGHQVAEVRRYLSERPKA